MSGEIRPRNLADKALDEIDKLIAAVEELVDIGKQTPAQPGYVNVNSTFCWRCNARESTTPVGLCADCFEYLKNPDTTAPEPMQGPLSVEPQRAPMEVDGEQRAA